MMYKDVEMGGSSALSPIGWMLYDDADDPNPISNFVPEVLGLVEVHTEGAEPELCVKLKLNFSDGEDSKPFTIPLADLEGYDWHKKLRCVLNTPYLKAKQYLAKEICSALSGISVTTLHRISRLGTHIIDGEPVYNKGNELTHPSTNLKNRINVEVEKQSFNIYVDPDLGEAEAAVRMFELISLFPNAGRVILAHTLLYIMREVYKSAWKAPCCCVFLYGKTGTKKTTTSSFLTQLHNRSRGIANPARLNASIPAAVAILYEKSDCVVVLDDLFPAESTEIKRKQEQTLSEITRIIADGAPPARMRGKEAATAPPTCGVVFTGEYLVGTGSNAARLLPVEMTPPEGEKLKYFQDNPLIVSTFYRNFIAWFIEYYNAIRELLKEWLAVYREVRLGVHDRLQETHYFLNTSYALLLQYCYDKGFISSQDAQAMHRSFVDLLSDLVWTQQERVELGLVNVADRIDFLAYIRTIFRDGEFLLADSAEEFKRGHEGLIHNGCLCLRGDKLRKLFPDVRLDDIADNLLTRGALRPGADKRGIQIYGTGGKRFYAIPLNKL